MNTETPAWLDNIADSICEGLPPQESESFRIEFTRAIPQGVDLNPVRHKFLEWLMDENLKRVESLDIPAELKSQVTAAIGRVRDLHVAESTDEAAWAAAEAAAEAAAWLAAEAGAWAAREAAAAAAAAAASEAPVREVARAAWAAGATSTLAAASFSASSLAMMAAESAVGSASFSAASAGTWAEAATAAWRRYRDELIRLLAEAK